MTERAFYAAETFRLFQYPSSATPRTSFGQGAPTVTVDDLVPSDPPPLTRGGDPRYLALLDELRAWFYEDIDPLAQVCFAEDAGIAPWREMWRAIRAQVYLLCDCAQDTDAPRALVRSTLLDISRYALKTLVFWEQDQGENVSGIRFLALVDELAMLHIRKGADYGRGQDCLANLRGSHAVGIAPWLGTVIRLLDKVHRITEYCRSGRLANEGVRDSFLDLASYALLALVLWEEENGEAS